MEKITVYYPRLWTKEFHESQKRWKVLVIHRRAGKTTACLNHLIRDATQNNNSRYAYIAPTYKQAKNVAWDILKSYCNKVEGVKYNEAELRVDFANQSRITLYGADNPDALRGIGLLGVVFDEYSQQPSNIFSEIIRPCLADHNGYAIWIGTPKGKNEFYRLYQQALNNSDWLAMKLTVDDTGIISQKELEDSRTVMSPDEFEQEWYCSFESSIKGAYYARQIAQARQDGRIRTVSYDEALKVHTVWDLGTGQNMGIGFFQKTGVDTRMIDYWEGSNQDGLPQAIKAVKNKSYIYGRHFAPHDIRAKDIGTGKTRIEIAKSLGIDFKIVPKLSMANGIEAGRIFWSHLWIDEKKCQIWLDYMAQYHQEWDENRGAFQDTPYHDFSSHAADVCRYAAIVEKQMTNDESEVYKQLPYRPQTELESGEYPISQIEEMGKEAMGFPKVDKSIYRQDEYKFE